jgi:hypothetical protein
MILLILALRKCTIMMVILLKMVKLNFYVVMISNLLGDDDTFQEVFCHNEKLGENDEISKFYFYFTFLLKISNIQFYISVVVH